MADAAGIAGAIGPVAALLAPVVVLLFVALRFRRRIRYPHDFLTPRDERAPAAALFRSLRLYWDAAIDAACAVIVGLAIAGWPEPAARRGQAVVVDASLSMLAGLRGDRPLDEAARLVFADAGLRGSTMFALGWDPRKGGPSLRDVTGALEDSASPQEFAAALEASEAFMSADFSLVAGLARRGYGPVTLLTDDQAVDGPGIDLRRIAARPPRYLYPASAAWDEEAGRGVVCFVAAGGASIMALWRVSPTGELSRAKPEEWAISQSPSGFELSFPRPGLWAVQWYGHVLPFEVPGRPGPLSAAGAFPAAIVAALARAGGGESENDGAAGGAIVRGRGRTGVPGALSVVRAEREGHLMPPRLTLGAVVAAGLDRKADLSLGPAALASKESATPFWLLRVAQGATAQPARPPRRLEPVRVGDGCLYPGRGTEGPRLVVPPAGEYAPTGRRELIPAAEPPRRRLPVALALAALYALKLVLARRFRGRGASRASRAYEPEVPALPLEPR